MVGPLCVRTIFVYQIVLFINLNWSLRDAVRVKGQGRESSFVLCKLGGAQKGHEVNVVFMSPEVDIERNRIY